MSVVWTTDSAHAQTSKLIYDFDDNAGSTYLYLANTLTMPDIVCPDGCGSIDVDIIYGSSFDKLCRFGTDCEMPILDANAMQNVYLTGEIPHEVCIYYEL